MANDLEALILTISADTRQIKRALDRLDGDVSRSARNIETKFAGAKRSMDAFAASVSGVSRGLLAGLGIGFAAQDFLKTVQSVNSLGQSLKAITGDSAAADKEMKFLTETSERLGLEIISAGQAYVSLLAATKGTSLEGEETRRVFEAVSSAMASLGKSADDTQGALLAIQQMISKGTVSSEELRGQLGERLPGAFRLAAQALGVTEQELGKLLEKGVVPATELIPRLTDKLNELYGTDRKSTLTAEINRLNNAVTKLYKTLADVGAIGLVTSALGQLRDVVKEISVYANLLGNGRFKDALTGTFGGLDDLSFAKMKLRLGQGESLTGAQSAEWDKLLGATGGEPTTLTVGRPKPAFEPAAGTEKLDSYQRMTRMIQERIQVIDAETAAQASINPLINDYGYAIERARAETDLLNAAERAGINITPEVRQNIEDLADAYAQATVDPERLREEQQRLVDQAADLNDLGRDVLGGFIDDMQNGVTAAEALANALEKIGDKLLDMALNSLFNPAGSGGGGLIGALMGAFTGQPARAGGGPVAAGRPYTVGEQGPETFVPNVAGRILPNHVGAGGSVAANVPISISIDARGADEAGLVRVQSQLAQLRREVPGLVVKSIIEAHKRNTKGI